MYFLLLVLLVCAAVTEFFLVVIEQVSILESSRITLSTDQRTAAVQTVCNAANVVRIGLALHALVLPCGDAVAVKDPAWAGITVQTVSFVSGFFLCLGGRVLGDALGVWLGLKLCALRCNLLLFLCADLLSHGMCALACCRISLRPACRLSSLRAWPLACADFAAAPL
jgi:hypothetical protein